MTEPKPRTSPGPVGHALAMVLSSERVLFLAPMPAELAPLKRRLGLKRRADDPTVRMGRHGRHDVLATTLGIGTERAAQRTAALLDAHPVDRVIVIGVAGGLVPHVEVGSVVVPEVVVDHGAGTEHVPAPHPAAGGRVLTSDEFIKEHERLHDLAADGIVALDMETSAVGRVCDDRGVPWWAFRGISDDAFDPAVDAAVLGLTRPDGSSDPAAVARLLAADPKRAALLRRLADDLRVATTAAVDAALDALA